MRRLITRHSIITALYRPMLLSGRRLVVTIGPPDVRRFFALIHSILVLLLAYSARAALSRRTSGHQSAFQRLLEFGLR